MSLQEKKDLLASLQKDIESPSEDLEQAIDTYLSTYFGSEQEKQDWPFLKKMAIHFADWQKQKDAEAINENALLYNARLEGIEIGKAEMKQKMMKDAAKVSICIPYENRYGGYTQLVDTDRILPIGEHIVIVIKEE